MERLTNETLDNAIDVYETTLAVCNNGLLADDDYNPMLDRCTLSFLKELKEYRKMEEQGLLLKLIKEGYILHKNHFDKIVLKHIDFDEIEPIYEYEGVCEEDELPFGIRLFQDDFRIILTKEKAEKALAEMEKKDALD